MSKILIDEATVKLVLEALEHCKDVIVERGLNGNPEFAERWGLTLPLDRSKEAITALKALAEQPAQQGPVAWMHERKDGERIPLMYSRDDRNDDNPKSVRPLVYGDTSPQPAQRTWRGLTDKEFEEIIMSALNATIPVFLWQLIQDRLKEKNT